MSNWEEIADKLSKAVQEALYENLTEPTRAQCREALDEFDAAWLAAHPEEAEV